MINSIFLQAGDGGVANIIEYFGSPESTIDSAATVAKTILVAELFAPTFFFLSLGYMYVSTWIKESHKGKFFDQGELKRLLIIMILIPAAPLIFHFFQFLGSASAKVFEMDPAAKFDAITSLYSKVSEGPEEDFNLLFLSMTAMYKLMALFLMIISILLMYIIKFIILLFSGIFIQFCIIVSPLAMAFSMLPIFKDQVEKLLAICINACFVGLTMNILDTMLFDSLFQKVISSLDDPAADVFNYIIIASTCFTVVILYLMAFWLTAKYVGSGAAAAIMSTATTAATMMAMGAVKAASMGSKAATGAAGGDPLASIVKGAADSIRKEK